MLGVETAGLVLAVLPLLISALEHYKKGLKPIKTIGFTWKKELDSLIRSLNEQKFFFKATLRRIVIAAAPSEDDVKLSEDLANVLRSGSVRTQVEEYLKDVETVDFFDEQLEAYKSSLEDIVAKLTNIQRPVQSPNDLSGIIDANPEHEGNFLLKKSLRFAMKQEEMKGLVRKLDTCNKNLSRFLRDLDAIHRHQNQIRNPTKEQEAVRLAATLQQVHEHARALHAAISTGWPPDCHPLHETVLFLESRSAVDPGAQSNCSGKTSSFRILLASDPDSKNELQSWYESTIVIDEKGNQLPAADAETNDLCRRFSETRPPGQALVLDLTQSSKLVCCDSKTCQAWLDINENPQSVSLEDLLSIGPCLTPRQKTVLAFNLASSVLQLHTTQWIGHSWTKKAIRFFQRQKASRTITDAARPFISRIFPESSFNGDDENVSRDLLEFGILLLEIWEQCTFESWTTTQAEKPATKFYPRMAQAVEWLETSEENLTTSYAAAVSVCVRFSFEGVQPSWDNPNFRYAFCEKVIVPLQKNCKAWTEA